MDFLEKDLEKIVFETDSDALLERGLPLKGKRYRQLRIGNYGIADLVTFEKIDNRPFEEVYIKITVYEFKKDDINGDTFWQSLGYVNGIRRYLNKTKRFTNFYIQYKIVLCGRYVNTRQCFVYLNNIFNNVNLYTYKYSFDGISFNNETGYKLSDEGF